MTAVADREVDLQPVDARTRSRRPGITSRPPVPTVGGRSASAGGRVVDRRRRHRPRRIEVAGDPDAVERDLRRDDLRADVPSRAEQRGANRQPGGGSRRSGGEPGMTSSVRRSACDVRERAPAASGCTGGAVAGRPPSTGPSSATRPAYMIRTRSHVSAMTDRSWVIRISDSPSFVRRSSSSSRIWAWTMTSRAVVGSSPMTIAGSQASAIAIIARWRMPPDSSCG